MDANIDSTLSSLNRLRGGGAGRSSVCWLCLTEEGHAGILEREDEVVEP